MVLEYPSVADCWFTEITINRFIDRVGGRFRDVTTMSVHSLFLILLVQNAQLDHPQVGSEIRQVLTEDHQKMVTSSLRMALSTNFAFFATVGMFAVAKRLATSLLGISALRRLGTPSTIATASSQIISSGRI